VTGYNNPLAATQIRPGNDGVAMTADLQLCARGERPLDRIGEICLGPGLARRIDECNRQGDDVVV
jgi:hypothetical protein